MPFLRLRKSFPDIKKDAPLVFALHGDAAPHTETDSLLVVSLRSLTTKLSVSESQLLLFALPKSMISKETLQPIWKILCRSLEAMTKGRWPTKAPGNLPTYKVAHLQSQQWRQTSHGLGEESHGDFNACQSHGKFIDGWIAIEHMRMVSMAGQPHVLNQELHCRCIHKL